LVPVVGPAISAIYVDRRHAPRSFTFSSALASAAIQLVALVILTAIILFIVVVVLGISVSLQPSVETTWRS